MQFSHFEHKLFEEIPEMTFYIPIHSLNTAERVEMKLEGSP